MERHITFALRMNTCSHCGLLALGYSTVDGDVLCHPDTGMDCYKLVTVYHHVMPCDEPLCVASAHRRTLRESNRAIPDEVST